MLAAHRLAQPRHTGGSSVLLASPLLSRRSSLAETQCCSLATEQCIGERCKLMVGSRTNMDQLHGMQGCVGVSGEVSSHIQDCPLAHCNLEERRIGRGCTAVMLPEIEGQNELPRRQECGYPSRSST